jgi:uncharacterized protein with ATP-grasp and redox domains
MAKKDFEQIEEKILHDRQYLLDLLKKVVIADNSDFSIVGGTISKISETLARLNEQLFNLEKSRLATKKSDNSSIDNDYKELADSVPTQFSDRTQSPYRNLEEGSSRSST